MPKKIVIVDYNMGNLASVANALDYIGYKAIISNKVDDIKSADYIILPGVGAFADGMKNLIDLGLVDVLKEQVLERKKPFLGLCLGMQLAAEKGYENGLTQGLGFIKGKVKKFDIKNKDLRIPHIGWNEVYFKKNCILFDKLNKSEVFYFVHSYCLFPESRIFPRRHQ